MKKWMILGILMGRVFLANAQMDSSKKDTTRISGSLDTYYRYDLANSPRVTNNLTSFTNSNNSFELGMLSVQADHSFGNVSATANLGFGKRAEEFSYHDSSSAVAIKQLTIAYAPSSVIKFTMGKWATHIGYEMADAFLNRNYSMSYSFSYGPFFHTGVKADISLGGNAGFMIGISNPTDYSSTRSSAKVLLAQFGAATGNGRYKAIINFLGGDSASQLDLVLNGTLSNRFSIHYDGTVKWIRSGSVPKHWSGNALYVNYDPSASFGISLRGEYFSDPEDATGIGTQIAQATLSFQFHVNQLTIIPEIRVETAGKDIYIKSQGNATNREASCILAAVYTF